MFSAVRIGTSDLDVGSIAEAMVYYGRVNVFVRGGSLAELVERLGFEPVMAALDLGVLELAFERTGFGVVSNKYGTSERHDMGNFSLAGTHDGQKIENATDEIDYQFRQRFGRSAEISTRARSLAERVREMPIDDRILPQARKDVKDTAFVDAAIRAWLKVMAPEYLIPDDLHVEIVTTKEGFSFLGRLDFDAINKVYHQHIPASHSSVTPAYLLAQFLDARKELSLAADMSTELWVGDGLAAILQQRVGTMIAAATKVKEDIAYFHNVEFEGRSFREAINKREKSGADLIALLQDEETRKFKIWLGAQNPEGRLIKEYDRAIFARHGWTQRLPFKLGKIGIFAGLGVAVDAGLGTMGLATAAVTALSAGSDLAVGATDEFVLSKILGGWKPNQFIEGPARQFLQSDPPSKRSP